MQLPDPGTQVSTAPYHIQVLCVLITERQPGCFKNFINETGLGCQIPKVTIFVVFCCEANFSKVCIGKKSCQCTKVIPWEEILHQQGDNGSREGTPRWRWQAPGDRCARTGQNLPL